MLAGLCCHKWRLTWPQFTWTDLSGMYLCRDIHDTNHLWCQWFYSDIQSAIFSVDDNRHQSSLSNAHDHVLTQSTQRRGYPQMICCCLWEREREPARAPWGGAERINALCAALELNEILFILNCEKNERSICGGQCWHWGGLPQKISMYRKHWTL